MIQIRFSADSMFRVFAFARTLATWPKWKRIRLATADNLLARGLARELETTEE